MRFQQASIVAAVALLAACTDPEPVAVNNTPFADAGPGVTQPADQEVTLDGRASYDPDGDPLVYHWVFDHAPVGSRFEVDSSSGFAPNHVGAAGTTTFQPDVVGTYVVKLLVSDAGNLYSQPDYVIVTAMEPEEAPTANAGHDKVVNLGETATLDGNQSFDPLGGLLSYQWYLAEVPFNSTLSADSLSGADTSVAQLTGDVTGFYTATLVVNNGQANSLPDSVLVQVQGDNEAPTADAGADMGVEDCTWIELDCSGSFDPEGNQLQYFWEIQVKPNGSKVQNNAAFVDRFAGRTNFFPDVAGGYQLSCSVFDGTTWSMPDFLEVAAVEREINSPPIANAGADRVESMGEAECEEDGYKYDCGECPALSVTLAGDGEASDADSDPIVISWTIVEGKAKLLGSKTVPTETVLGATEPEEPGACSETSFIFELNVVDCPGVVSTDQVEIIGECCGIEPGA